MRKLNESGQTLIALLIFMLVAMTVTLASIAIAITNIQAGNSISSGELALQNAQSGIENTLINLERNPSYSGGTMALSNGNATITVSGTGILNIISEGNYRNFHRKITVNATNTANVINITSWSETP